MSIYDDGPTETNRTRANWAVIALEAFGKQTGQNYTDGTLNVDADELREVAGDLLANLFHLARINGIAPEAITEAAYLHFGEEVREEEREAPENVVHCPACGGPVWKVSGSPYRCADCGGGLPGGSNAGPERYWDITEAGWLVVMEDDEQ